VAQFYLVFFEDLTYLY